MISWEAEIKEKVFMMLGEASALFMSQPIKGTEIVMPDRELSEIGDRFLAMIPHYDKSIRRNELAVADERLKTEYGEDWLTYRDDRYKELADEVSKS